MKKCRATFAAAAVILLPLVFVNPAASTQSGSTDSATVHLGGEDILTLRSSAGGLTPEQRVDIIDGRISSILGTPNIKTSDVAIYTPAGKPPVIYALGRRLITVDAATVKAAGGSQTALALATTWAKKLQQVLPRVNWRPSDAPEPTVPKNPPLTITSDLSKVGGAEGSVTLNNHVVLKLRGPQPDGMTCQERADLLSKRLQSAIHTTGAISDDTIVAVPDGPQTGSKVKGGEGKRVTIKVADVPILTVDETMAKAANSGSAASLAHSWVKNIRVAAGLPAVPDQTTSTAAATSPAVPTAPTAPAAATSPAVPTAPAAPSAPAAPQGPAVPDAPAVPNPPTAAGEPTAPAAPSAPAVPNDAPKAGPLTQQ